MNRFAKIPHPPPPRRRHAFGLRSASRIARRGRRRAKAELSRQRGEASLRGRACTASAAGVAGGNKIKSFMQDA